MASELPIPVEQIRLAHEQDMALKSKSRKQYERQKAWKRYPLEPWQYKLAEWYVAQRVAKQRVDHLQIATYARVFQTQTKAEGWDGERAFTKRDWDNLNRRVDWLEYIDLLQTSLREAARRKLADNSLKFVDSHIKGLELAEQEKDYRQIYKYTVPMLERIDPVKQQAPIAAVQVILTQAQQQGLDAELPAIEAEIIPE